MLGSEPHVTLQVIASVGLQGFPCSFKWKGSPYVPCPLGIFQLESCHTTRHSYSPIPSHIPIVLLPRLQLIVNQ